VASLRSRFLYRLDANQKTNIFLMTLNLSGIRAALRKIGGAGIPFEI
jgi:hypothetical protein